MKTNFMKIFILLLTIVMGMSKSYGETATLIFTSNCNGTGTDDKENVWTITSDAEEASYEGARGIHYGTGSAAVSYLKLSTSTIKGEITKIEVYAATAQGNVTSTIAATVGGASFGSSYTLLNDNTLFTFEGKATGTILITLSQKSATKGLYVKQIVVTYTDSSTLTTPTLTLGTHKESMNIGDDDDEYAVTYVGDGSLTASSSDESIATAQVVDGKVVVSAIAAGTVTITVYASQTAKYSAAKVSYTLQVIKPYSSGDYEAVVSIYNNVYYAMTDVVKDGKLGVQEVVVMNDKVYCSTDDSKAIAWKITRSNSACTVTSLDNLYLGYGGSSSSTNPSTNLTLSSSTYHWVIVNNMLKVNSSDDSRYVALYKGNLRFGAYVIGTGTVSCTAPILDFATEDDGYIRSGLSDGKVGTICLDRTIDADNLVGAKFYSIVGKRLDSDGKPTSIVLKEETGGLTAGVPYIFIADAKDLFAAYSGSTGVTEASNKNGLYGVLGEAYTVSDDDTDIYAIANNTVRKAASGSTVKKNRAYIKMADVPEYTAGSSSVKGIEFPIGEDVTGISLISSGVQTSQMYNLQGQRISVPVHGQIYIKDGQKYMAR